MTARSAVSSPHQVASWTTHFRPGQGSPILGYVSAHVPGGADMLPVTRESTTLQVSEKQCQVAGVADPLVGGLDTRKRAEMSMLTRQDVVVDERRSC